MLSAFRQDECAECEWKSDCNECDAAQVEHAAERRCCEAEVESAQLVDAGRADDDEVDRPESPYVARPEKCAEKGGDHYEDAAECCENYVHRGYETEIAH